MLIFIKRRFKNVENMNRLIIIGNGFDLAHGLKTSYNDLMDFIKLNTDLSKRNYNDNDCGTRHYKFNETQSDYIAFKYEPDTADFVFSICEKHRSIYFSQLFNKFNKYKNWVDLESLYFKVITEHSSNIKDIELINKEFKHLKEILEYYLNEQIEKKLIEFDFSQSKLFSDNNNAVVGVVNFNYTNKLIYNYLIHSSAPFIFTGKSEMINIHGDLFNRENPIIFGYGDDNSDEYKKIQDLGENKLLINFKTFQYLRNSNYKKVIAILNKKTSIKVEIIGHSCGLSDKTLLKTIFEHPNVEEIEYRYHSNDKNYFENLYNISRIFSDNSMMRKRLVDFENTRIIEQISLFG
jgi:transcription elongation factor Elf1